ncbi:MAG: ribosome-associated translation inhibitor RaiA [Acidobacteriota bacterium]
MRLELTGRHIDITPALRRIVDAKLAKLERLLNDSAVSAQVVLTREKFRRNAEITLHARGENFLHGVGSSETWERSMTQAVEKIAHQAEKVKGKWQERKRGGVRRAPRAAEPGPVAPKPAARTAPKMPKIFRSSHQPIRTMSVADAAREVDRRDGLVIFRDPERTSVSVLYRQANGELMLVETES